jgi:hypothetical protein
MGYRFQRREEMKGLDRRNRILGDSAPKHYRSWMIEVKWDIWFIGDEKEE